MDEVQRLILQVEGENRLRELIKLQETQKQTMAEIIALQQKQGGTLGQAQHAQLMRSAEGFVATNQQVKELQKSVGGAMGAMGSLQIGYALQDFFAAQGGPAQKFNAIANNLQMLAVSMGVGGGWFVAITGVIAGLQAVASNWDAIESHFRDMPDPKELKAKAEKAKKDAAEFQALKDHPAPADAFVAGAAKEDLSQYAGDRLAVNLKDALVAEGGAANMTDKELTKFAQSRKFKSNEELRQAAEQENARRKGTQYEAETQRLMLDAQKPGPAGEAARQRMRDLNKDHPGILPPELLDSIAPGPGQGTPWAGGFVGPPIEGGGDARPPAPMAGLRGFRYSSQQSQQEHDEDARRRAAGALDRKQRRAGAGQLPAEARPVEALGPEEVDAQLRALEASMEQAQSTGQGNPQWFASTSRRIQALAARQNQILLWQSRQNGGQQYMGNYSYMPLGNQ